MALRNGKCTNFGLCTKADTREVQNTPDGPDFVCQECRRPLTAVGGASAGRQATPIVPLAILALAILLLGGAAYYFLRAPSSPAPLLRLSGSNTIGAELAVSLTEAWLTQRGATGVRHETPAADETRVLGTQAGAPVADRRTIALIRDCAPVPTWSNSTSALSRSCGDEDCSSGRPTNPINWLAMPLK